jgi:hypothetical protein
MRVIFLLFFLFIIMGFNPAISLADGGHHSTYGGNHHIDYPSHESYQPHLENARHLQLPQWGKKSWYAENWLAQREGMDLINGFYQADIFRDQYEEELQQPVLVVGPSFYRLSGFDKRRVTTILDEVFSVTQSSDGAFILKDWFTKATIGVFDREGLRLH